MNILRPLFATLATAFLITGCSDRNGDDSETPSAAATATTAAASTATTTTTAAPASPSRTTAAAVEGPAEFEGSRALAHIDHLSSAIGPRVSGTEGETATVEYLRGEFERLGYAVELFEFAFESDPFRTSAVTIGGVEHSGFAMTGSGSGRVTAMTAFVGLADEAGIDGRDLTGLIAVADRGEIRFSAKLENVIAAGAIGLVVINNEEGDFVGNLSGQADVPAVTVSSATGEAIRRFVQQGAEMTLDVPGGASTSSVNVIARPSPDAKCTVLVGGHHDTVPEAPGAHDNGSGTGAILELARAFAVDGLEEGLCFATFGGEESGLNGSRALAQELDAGGEVPEVMVNIDANGVGTRVGLIGSPELTARAAALALEMGIAADVTELGAQFGSDHQSFEAVGVPVLFFTSDDLGFIHTPEDTFDTLSPAVVEAGGDLAFATISELIAGDGAR